jgi:hypothetical protein
MQVIEFMEESDTFLPPVVKFKGINTVVSISRLAAFTGADRSLASLSESDFMVTLYFSELPVGTESMLPATCRYINESPLMWNGYAELS